MLSGPQLDLPGTPFRRAKRAKAYILERIAGRVAAKRDAMLAAGPAAQRSTLLEHYMGARLADGDDLDTHFLSVRAAGCCFKYEVLHGQICDMRLCWYGACPSAKRFRFWGSDVSTFLANGRLDNVPPLLRLDQRMARLLTRWHGFWASKFCCAPAAQPNASRYSPLRACLCLRVTAAQSALVR